MMTSNVVTAEKAFDWDRVPAEERKKLVGEIYIERDTTTLLKTVVDKVRSDRAYLPEPSCVLITGDTGTGKSTFLKHYVQDYPVDRGVPGRPRRPVIYVELSVRCTISDAATAILDALGDPGADVGKQSQRSRRVRHLLVEQGVEAVLIDEFQHIVEASGERTLNKVGDWLKQQAKATNIPFVLAGMPNAASVIDANKQFAGICPYRFELGKFEYGSKAEKLAFRKFLAVLDSNLPFNELSKFSDPLVAAKLFKASKGNLRQLSRLLQQAAFSAIARGAACVESVDLAAGYETIELMASLVGNPFLDGSATADVEA